MEKLRGSIVATNGTRPSFAISKLPSAAPVYCTTAGLTVCARRLAQTNRHKQHSQHPPQASLPADHSACACKCIVPVYVSASGFKPDRFIVNTSESVRDDTRFEDVTACVYICIAVDPDVNGLDAVKLCGDPPFIVPVMADVGIRKPVPAPVNATLALSKYAYSFSDTPAPRFHAVTIDNACATGATFVTTRRQPHQTPRPDSQPSG